MIRNNTIFINFIRNFANHLAEYQKKFYLQSKIDSKNLYNVIHDNEDRNKLKNNIINKLSKLS
jgi:hypothetical protein